MVGREWDGIGLRERERESTLGVTLGVLLEVVALIMSGDTS